MPATHGISVIAGNRVYTVAGTLLLEIDLSTGELRHTIDLAEWAPGSNVRRGRVSATDPLWAGGLVVLGISRQGIGRVAAFDMRSGRPRWTYDSRSSAVSTGAADSRGPIDSDPAIWRDRVIIRTGFGLTELGLADGKEFWNVPFGDPSIYPILSSHPAVAGNVVYFNADAGVAAAYSASDGRLLWSTPVDGYLSVDVPVLHERKIAISNTAPLFLDDRIYIADGSGGIYCLNALDGTRNWKAKVGLAHEFAACQGRLYAATDTGFYELDPASGEPRHAYPIAGGAWHCLVAPGQAAISHNPFWSGGWEIVDLTTWKQLWSDSAFAPLAPPAAGGGRFVWCGNPTGQLPGGRSCQLRGYANP